MTFATVRTCRTASSRPSITRAASSTADTWTASVCRCVFPPSYPLYLQNNHTACRSCLPISWIDPHASSAAVHVAFPWMSFSMHPCTHEHVLTMSPCDNGTAESHDKRHCDRHARHRAQTGERLCFPSPTSLPHLRSVHQHIMTWLPLSRLSQSLLCDDAPDAKNCPLIYSQPVETDKRFYIADIERYRLLIDHGVLPTLPDVSGESR